MTEHNPRSCCCNAEVFPHERIMGAYECGHCGREVNSDGSSIWLEEGSDEEEEQTSMNEYDIWYIGDIYDPAHTLRSKSVSVLRAHDLAQHASELHRFFSKAVPVGTAKLFLKMLRKTDPNLFE